MGDFYLSADGWAKLWKEGKTEWHIEKLCDMFVKHKDRMINGRSGIKVFVPLCGKAVEMQWLWEKGHEVVGVDSGEVALVQFFEENKIEYKMDDIPKINGKLYKSIDNKIRLYCCDFYLFNSEIEKEFGAVWDSGSLSAINFADEDKYIAVIKSVMGSGCVHLIVIDDVDAWEMSINLDKLKNWFSEGFTAESVEYIPANEELKAMDIKGQELYCITKD